jgi:hypothetical protein
MKTVGQAQKSKGAGSKGFREDQLVIGHRHVQSLRQVFHQLLIVRIGKIELKQARFFNRKKNPGRFE